MLRKFQQLTEINPNTTKTQKKILLLKLEDYCLRDFHNQYAGLKTKLKNILGDRVDDLETVILQQLQSANNQELVKERIKLIQAKYTFKQEIKKYKERYKKSFKDDPMDTAWNTFVATFFPPINLIIMWAHLKHDLEENAKSLQLQVKLPKLPELETKLLKRFVDVCTKYHATELVKCDITSSTTVLRQISNVTELRQIQPANLAALDPTPVPTPRVTTPVVQRVNDIPEVYAPKVRKM